MILGNSLILTLFVVYCESYNGVYQQVGTDGGIKSYGGYFPDASGQNKAASQFVNSQNYQQPSLTSYQPYGWNFNQPSKTYGGVNVFNSRHDSEHQHNQHQGNIGWADRNINNMANTGANVPMFNNFPFFQMPQFPFPQFPFPNFNHYPNYQPNYEPGNLPYPNQPNHPHPPNMFPMLPTSTHPTALPNSVHSSFDDGLNQQRPNNNGFSTNNFFESTDDRQWSNEKEKQWQATTKKPFFENTVPGFGCTLPAASIIGAKDVFSAVELLPLSVPFGKPILSCNATGLKQTNVKIKNKLYSCQDGVINIECRAGNGNNNCPGNVLMCDLRSQKKISCTNGTLFSNADLECATIQIGKNWPQSVLNCDFKDEEIDIRFQGTTRMPSFDKRTTTRAPFISPTRRRTPTTTMAKPFDSNNDQQTLENIERDDLNDQNLLGPQLKSSMQNIFPHDLLLKPSIRLLPPREYLPPSDSQAYRDLYTSMRGVFPMELLVVSKSKGGDSDGISNAPSIDTRLSENSDNQINNQRTNNDDVGFKTQLSVKTRFGENTQKPLHQQQDFHDRLIFSS